MIGGGLVGPIGLLGPVGEGRRRPLESEPEPEVTRATRVVRDDERDACEAARSVSGVVDHGRGLAEEDDGVPWTGELDGGKRSKGRVG